MRLPPPTKKRAPEIRALTGARGIPVLLIALFHYHEWYGYSGALWYDTIVSKGYIWVDFFFALSGFILFYAYGSRFGVGLKAEAIGAFLAARVSRIYPLQLATLHRRAVLWIEYELLPWLPFVVQCHDSTVMGARSSARIDLAAISVGGQVPRTPGLSR